MFSAEVADGVSSSWISLEPRLSSASERAIGLRVVLSSGPRITILGVGYSPSDSIFPRGCRMYDKR